MLKLKDRCRRCQPRFESLLQKAWRVEAAPTKADFWQRVRWLRQWAQKEAPDQVRHAVLALCLKRPVLAAAYNFPHTYPTSNAVDRLMEQQDGLLHAMRYLHGTTASATPLVPTHAMLWNFHPYGAHTGRADPGRSSPVGELNGF